MGRPCGRRETGASTRAPRIQTINGSGIIWNLPHGASGFACAPLVTTVAPFAESDAANKLGWLVQSTPQPISLPRKVSPSEPRLVVLRFLTRLKLHQLLRSRRLFEQTSFVGKLAGNRACFAKC